MSVYKSVPADSDRIGGDAPQVHVCHPGAAVVKYHIPLSFGVRHMVVGRHLGSKCHMPHHSLHRR